MTVVRDPAAAYGPTVAAEGEAWSERGTVPPSPRGGLSRSSSLGSIPSTDESVIYEWQPKVSPSLTAQAEPEHQVPSWPMLPVLALSTHLGYLDSPQFSEHQQEDEGTVEFDLTIEEDPEEFPIAHQVVRVAASGVEGGSETPTVDELRRLQCRLSQVTGELAERRGPRRILSNGSVSTMVSEGEDAFARSPSPPASLQNEYPRRKVQTTSAQRHRSQPAQQRPQRPGRQYGPSRSGHSPRCFNGRYGASDSRASGSDGPCSSTYDKPWHRRPLPKEYRHGHVPKNLNLEEEYKQQGCDNAPTTLMVRNIPNHYTQRQLISELDDLGFRGTFDFLYIPLDKGTMSNVGYAFVNFVEPIWAERCMAAFQSYRFKRHRKIAAVSVAHIQGLEANLAHYENAAVNTAKLKQRRPVIMANISKTLSSALEKLSMQDEQDVEQTAGSPPQSPVGEDGLCGDWL